MNTLIEAAGVTYALDYKQTHYNPLDPLKILLVGYNGTRNTGSDYRVEEMIRQFRTFLGDQNIELSIITLDPELTAGYFRTVRQVHMPIVFPKFLFNEVQKYHGVIACEGSMFKSKFANSLSTLAASGLGLAAVSGKLSVGYGAEAGEMDPSLHDFVRKQCKNSLIICRNQQSRQILAPMGIRTRGGADTGWTFVPTPKDRSEQLLRDHGWDGRKRVLAVCPINPFWWPVKPDLIKSMANRLGGQYRKEHYQTVYFHRWSEESADKFETYINGIVKAVGAFARDKNLFTIVMGTEQLDREACEIVAERLPFDSPVFVSDSYNMYELVGMLHACSLVLSSRFHAIIGAMCAFVPTSGITLDERIRNLMHDRGHSHLLLEVDDPDLEEKTLEMLYSLDREREEITAQTRAFIPSQLKLMGQMGIDLEDEIMRVYPDFPKRDVPRSWEYYLPKLSPAFERLLGEET